MIRLPVYILAGGGSSRFGSDKARARVDGEPMLARVANMIGPLAESITVVAKADGAYDDLALTTIGDSSPGLGPMGGLATALQHRGDGWLILLACDLLTLHPAWFETLWAAHRDDALAIAFRHDKWEPMLSLYHTDVLQMLDTQLAADARSMQALFTGLANRAVAVGLPEDWPVRLQANRPDDIV